MCADVEAPLLTHMDIVEAGLQILQEGAIRNTSPHSLHSWIRSLTYSTEYPNKTCDYVLLILSDLVHPLHSATCACLSFCSWVSFLLLVWFYPYLCLPVCLCLSYHCLPVCLPFLPNPSVYRPLWLSSVCMSVSVTIVCLSVFSLIIVCVPVCLCDCRLSACSYRLSVVRLSGNSPCACLCLWWSVCVFVSLTIVCVCVCLFEYRLCAYLTIWLSSLCLSVSLTITCLPVCDSDYTLTALPI